MGLRVLVGLDDVIYAEGLVHNHSQSALLQQRGNYLQVATPDLRSCQDVVVLCSSELVGDLTEKIVCSYFQHATPVHTLLICQVARIPNQRHVHAIVRQGASERAPVVITSHRVEDHIELGEAGALEEERVSIVPGLVRSQRLDEVHVPLRAAGNSVAVEMSLCKLNSKAPDASAAPKDKHSLVALPFLLQQVPNVSKGRVGSETGMRDGSSLIVREVGRLESNIRTIYNAILRVCSIQLPHAIQSLATEHLVSNVEGRVLPVPHDPAAEVYPEDAGKRQGADGRQSAFPLFAVRRVYTGREDLHDNLGRLQLSHRQSREVAELRLEQCRIAVVRESHRQHLRWPLREVDNQKRVGIACDRPRGNTPLHELEGVVQPQHPQQSLFVHLLLGWRASSRAHARGKAHFSHG
mmetsp:Transcript_9210/g.30720  ORF Transcript_9210/g.30720 Transcript_9210/m.30720 type:complete len:409 (-) Transcript_9210:127-1353(-)